MAKRILIADDEADVVFATKEYLEAEGYEVLCAYDGAEALELLEDSASRPDLIVLDARMPLLSGWDVLRAIRGAEQWRSIPVIMVTAADQHADEARGWDLGVDWYHAKPLHPKDLVILVERVLQSNEAQADEDETSPDNE